MPEDQTDISQAIKEPIQIFVSYSHKDETLRDRLSAHLSSLERSGVIIEWHDRRIPPGDEWEEAIDERIETARMILLLISSDFMKSDYCQSESKRALERRENGEAIVIPVILRPCDWPNTPFCKLQALPRDRKAVTTWENEDEAFTNVVEGIRKAIEELQPRVNTPVQTEAPADRTARAKTLPLDLEEFAKQIFRQEVAEIKAANPYLLGEKFVGREREMSDLTRWLVSDENGMLCICDLGGTGKSALVWRWLNNQATRDALTERGIKQFWCSFYARGFDSLQFLRDLAAQLGGAVIDEPDTFRAQMKLQRFVLDRLGTGKWLLVLDGLEREMGAFVNPEHFQVDSEEQDRRNEKGEVFTEERYIRSPVFADFLRDLLKTRTKTLITTRLFPENLTAGDRPLPGVTQYPFHPMIEEDARLVWNISGDLDDSRFQHEFFESVSYHPQVISVVSAAVKEQPLSFTDWFNDLPEPDRQACLDGDALLTVRRHRWLELAARDLIQDHRDAWLTICYIVRRSEASSVDALMKNLVDPGSTDAARPGRFRSPEKLIEVLSYLQKRRLAGVDFARGLVDVHPVIRGEVMRYILKQYEQDGKTDEEMVRHLESGEDSRELMVRFLNQPNLEARFQSLSPALETFSDSPSAQNAVLNILGRFYPETQPGGRRWLDGLPALRLRKDQAWVLLRTGHELMTRGLWNESAVVFNRASIAYELCGDLQSLEDCRHSHNWQILYGGSLFQSERHQLDALEKGGSAHAEYAPYWLALLLSIRQSEHAGELLGTLPAETSRWTLQTVAEAWFYLEEYEKAASLAQQAWDRREKEPASVAQSLWEAVTLGLSLVRMGRDAEAEPHLEFANSRGMGWCYNLVPMFALAGRMEYHYREASKTRSGLERKEKLSKAELVFKQYRKSDPDDRFQIPAAEAHLSMARVQLASHDRDEAIRLAHRALAIARKENWPFQYASVVSRAIKFLTGELKQPASAIEEPSFEALNHDERLGEWMKARTAQK